MSWIARPARRRPGLTAAIVVLLACAAILLILLPISQRAPRLTGCEADPPGHTYQLTPGQAGIAAIIAGVASRRALPARAVAIAYAAALQESKLANLDYGDLDSVGVFQQRPSQGWGSTRQLEDPVYATSRFFDALTAVHDYERKPIDIAAQDVQHSADGTAYGQYAAVGTALAAAFTGADPHAVWCTYAGPAGTRRLLAAGRAITSTFGLAAHPTEAGRAMSVDVGRAGQGWAVTAWLVSHAALYGIRSVRYLGYQWHGFTGPGRWTLRAATTRAPAASSAVQFG